MASLLSRLLLLAPIGVVERIVDLSGYPQAVQEHRKLSRYCNRRSFLCVLTSPRGYLLCVASEVRVSSEGTQDVVSAAYQKLPQHLISFLGDASLRISISRLLGGGHKPQVCSYRAALFEAVGVLHQGQHEGQRRERSDSLHLAQELGFLWVALLGDCLQLALVVPDALGERADRLQDGSEGRQKRLGDVPRRSVVEAPGRALGQAGPEGLDCSSEVVH